MESLARLGMLFSLSGAEVRPLGWQECGQICIHLNDGAADGVFIVFLCFLLCNQIVL